MTRFMALARHLETFFLQKRLLIHSHRPECILREESNELRQELVRKDELIRSVVKNDSRITKSVTYVTKVNLYSEIIKLVNS